AGKTLAGESDAGGGVFLMAKQRKVLIPMWCVVGVCVAATGMACLVFTLVMFCTVLMW
ncbi:TPA: hypothetical protein J1375_004293, partial [Escherichia coli]|nr:hypothetical protein [Escherichia coli]HBA8451757.1 hypothetical protein [Escherichia coli]HBA9527442.1 hypothetical protein [Escherichia coli]HBA9604035.1 hypothetical protein [Escherichia coli]